MISYKLFINELDEANEGVVVTSSTWLPRVGDHLYVAGPDLSAAEYVVTKVVHIVDTTSEGAATADPICEVYVEDEAES